MKKLLVKLEEKLFKLIHGEKEWADYYSLKNEIYFGNKFNYEYEKWYAQQ